MAQSQSQSHPLLEPDLRKQQATPFIVNFFPGLCLAISLVFVLVFWWKNIVGLYLDLRTGARAWVKDLGIVVRRCGWVGYTRVEIEGENESDCHDLNEGENGHRHGHHLWGRGSKARKHPSPYPSPRPSHLEDDGDDDGDDNSYNDTALDDDSESDSNSGSDSSSDDSDDSDDIHHQLAKYFDPETGLIYQHVLEPPSPALRTLQLSSESRTDRLGGDYTLIGSGKDTTKATAEKPADAETEVGWLNPLVEWAVGRFASLHEEKRALSISMKP